MAQARPKLYQFWQNVGSQYLPFADAASDDLPLGRLLRLSLFQISVGMSVVLLTGTLNRVMIVELGVATWLVALMVAIPLVFAPFRALIGHKSDVHKSYLGWRRVPYVWNGTLIQFGGLAIMPFALIVLSGNVTGPVPWGQETGAILAFLMLGAGVHTTQTAGLALASDLAPEESRPRVVALLYVMLLLGMVGSALVFSLLLKDFSQLRLIQVIQGAAVITLILNVVAVWKQEPRQPELTAPDKKHPSFKEAWNEFAKDGQASRLLLVVGVGTAGFTMQDILLEPYGGEILGLSVSQTTLLTALLAGGTLAGFAIAARVVSRGGDCLRLAAAGALFGIPAFSAVVISAAIMSPTVFYIGTALIGLGAGLFAVGTLIAAMNMASAEGSGIALGAWGAVQASAAGVSIALGGGLRDIFGQAAMSGALGKALEVPVAGYSFVYHIEIGLLFLTLVAIGPLVRFKAGTPQQPSSRFGLAQFPG